jgi:light-regulated signal transduction histidine kinase (bacteriophytochrome)
VNKELESYSHSVSHDLRTPLRFVNRIAHMLLHEPGAPLAKAATEQVNMILQATGEMAQLIEKLLAFSQASRVPLRKRRMDLRRLFQDVARELSCGGAEIDIQELAPCQGDRTLLKEVVVNLLENALKFTRRREEVRITVGCRKTAAETVYFVRDNGVGFDMCNADSLFVPYHRLHKAADFEGTGIGLALVKRIIERHGGRIWAEGEVDKGATFYFTVGNETAQ